MDEPTNVRLNTKTLERGLFAEGETPQPGFELGDPRLDAISDAAFKSQYDAAAGLAQQAWSDGTRDVRLLGYLVYGYYLQKDVAGLGWAFDQLTAALTTQWDVIGPPNKLKSADGGLNWLFQGLVRQLTGHEKLKDDHYQGWTKPGGADDFARAAAATQPLLVAVEQLFPTGKCLDKLRNLSGWLREQEASLRGLVDAAARQAAAEAAAEEARAAAAEAEATAPAGATTSDTPAAGNGSVLVEGAAPFALLLRKIKLFEQLIEKSDLQKAAVVARDVDHLVQSFDPIVFLPRVFVPYFRLMSRNMENLEPAMAQLEGPLFKSLVQLYHADLDAFADS